MINATIDKFPCGKRKFSDKYESCSCCGKNRRAEKDLCDICVAWLNSKEVNKDKKYPELHKELKDRLMIDYEKKENAIKDYELSKKLLEKFEKNNGYKI